MAPPGQPSATAARRDWASHIIHNPRLIFSSFILALVFFTFGFDGSVMGGILAMPPFNHQFGSAHTPTGPGLTSTDISVMTAVPTTGCLLGLPLAAYCGDHWGRRKTLLFGCVLSAVAAAIQTSAFGIAQLVIGRWLANAAIFIFIVMGSTFLAEIAPDELRGVLIGLSIVLIDAAAVLSSGINWAVSTNQSQFAFRFPMGLQIAFPAVITAGIFFLDDSPTFYLTRSEDTRALRSLRKVRKGYSEQEIEAEFAALKTQAALRVEEIKVPWTHLFKGVNLRRTLLALSIGNMQQLSGIAFATNYATIFLATIGSDISPFLLALAVAIVGFGGAIAGLFIVDAVGRRPLALATFIILFFVNLVIGVLGFTDYLHNGNISRAIAAFCCIFAFFFAAGFGPLTYVISGEMPTARLRNKTSAFSFFVLACFSTAVQYILPYIANHPANLGPKTYLIFAGWMFVCVVVTFIWFPETKGRTPAELDRMFEARIPARHFRNHVCNLNIETFLNEHKAGLNIVETKRM
ncbi:general substrate transporter [Clohesyomyces aquaticus]|uniref:General substrate transporter n=1 Tax=Clohesyomyces aquaticus TaxID=1231657 RepID=A0A1Y1YJY2_9PLEO|nr:general substrate transporter [Clohesyomyces aquaticus]